jgi:hypothetical protein
MSRIAFLKRAGPMIFFIIFIFSLGSAFLAYGAYPFYFGTLTRRWPTTGGIILSSEVKKETSRYIGTSGGHFARSPDGYHAVVNYKYVVNQKEFESDKIIHHPVGAGVYLSDYIPNECIKKYYPGKNVTVFYDPKKPEYAILEPGVNIPFSSYIAYILSGSFGIFLILVSTGYTLLAMHFISSRELGAWLGF